MRATGGSRVMRNVAGFFVTHWLFGLAVALLMQLLGLDVFGWALRFVGSVPIWALPGALVLLELVVHALGEVHLLVAWLAGVWATALETLASKASAGKTWVVGLATMSLGALVQVYGVWTS